MRRAGWAVPVRVYRPAFFAAPVEQADGRIQMSEHRAGNAAGDLRVATEVAEDGLQILSQGQQPFTPLRKALGQLGQLRFADESGDAGDLHGQRFAFLLGGDDAQPGSLLQVRGGVERLGVELPHCRPGGLDMHQHLPVLCDQLLDDPLELRELLRRGDVRQIRVGRHSHVPLLKVVEVVGIGPAERCVFALR